MTRQILDAHVHWRDPITNRYEALSDAIDEGGNASGAAARYLPEDYRNDASGYDIVGAVHIEAEWDHGDPVGESLWLEGLAEAGDTGSLAIVGFADLTKPDIAPVLEGHTRCPRVRGIRQMLNFLPGRPAYCWASADHISNPLWQKNYASLGNYGLDFDLMCFAHQMQPMAELIARSSDVNVHLEHTGMPWDHTEDGRYAWRQGMKALADLPNVDLKISGLGNTIEDWTTDLIRPYVLEAIEVFGVNRVAFASNFPTDKMFSDMATIWRAFEHIVVDFSAEEQHALFVGNAARMYRIELSEETL
ncbi:amidohydrolase family protein [Ruegeria jejuensis]|uniref:amidohydrolase family protein n=1 Tax=Ruegeria jejuensis TaxID=3233338 RepID=UPI00355AD977